MVPYIGDGPCDRILHLKKVKTKMSKTIDSTQAEKLLGINPKYASNFVRGLESAGLLRQSGKRGRALVFEHNDDLIDNWTEFLMKNKVRESEVVTETPSASVEGAVTE